MKNGDCGMCHWFQSTNPGNADAAGFCFESPPRVMLVPVMQRPSGKVLAPGDVQQQQMDMALQAVYPTVNPDQRCSRFKATTTGTNAVN